MPLPEHFYDSDGNEVSLDMLCRKEPAWAANRIRKLTKDIDELKINDWQPVCPGCGGYESEHV